MIGLPTPGVSAPRSYGNPHNQSAPRTANNRMGARIGLSRRPPNFMPQPQQNIGVARPAIYGFPQGSPTPPGIARGVSHPPQQTDLQQQPPSFDIPQPPTFNPPKPPAFNFPQPSAFNFPQPPAFNFPQRPASRQRGSGRGANLSFGRQYYEQADPLGLLGP